MSINDLLPSSGRTTSLQGALPRSSICVMISPMQLLALPASLLLLIAISPARAVVHDLQFPRSPHPRAERSLEPDKMITREIGFIERRLQSEHVVGMRKMSDDPGEKFFFDYWLFAPSEELSETSGQVRSGHDNVSSPGILMPPFPLHIDRGLSAPLLPGHLRSTLFGRSFSERQGTQCPNGTSACTSIDEPGSCCATGETCQLVDESEYGLGNVGCCPDGTTCAGTLTDCPSGYTSCPSYPGGGCCIPGYACFDSYCVLTSTIIVTTTIASSLSSSSLSASSPSLSDSTTTMTVPAGSSIPSSIATSIESLSSTSDSPRSTTTTTKSTSTTSISSAESYVPPLRPTGPTTTTTTTSISGAPPCPSGFYVCSAFYPPGCCRYGRDCNPTSCPASASTSVVNTDGVTVVVPTGSGITGYVGGETGSCATGMYSCTNGGCCMSGYACGTACTPTASELPTNSVGKAAPNSASDLQLSLRVRILGLVAMLIAFLLASQ